MKGLQGRRLLVSCNGLDGGDLEEAAEVEDAGTGRGDWMLRQEGKSGLRGLEW